MDEKLTISVPEIAKAMGIGRSKAYELVHMDTFPKIMLGTRIMVPREQFYEWFRVCVAAGSFDAKTEQGDSYA